MRFLLAAIVVLLSACATIDENVTDSTHQDVYKIYYGTDRERTDKGTNGKIYGKERGIPEYGFADVYVSPENGKSRLLNVEPLQRDLFLEQINRSLVSSDDRSVLVFIHGYNRSFSQIGRLVAEFNSMIDYDGVSVVWSWPSQQNPAAYLVDETNLSWSRAHIVRFLSDILAHTKADAVHLVGHSLGARSLSEIIQYSLLPTDLYNRIGEFILLAPDIDTQIFARDMAPEFIKTKIRLTLYTSANDKAMASARAIRKYPRVGDSYKGPLVMQGIETIDVTQANKSVLGHSYFEESSIVAMDLAMLIKDRRRAGERPGLEQVDAASGRYWRLTTE